MADDTPRSNGGSESDQDDAYANAYLDDDDGIENDSEELAEMFAKVQTMQQAEGIFIQPVPNPPPPSIQVTATGATSRSPSFSSRSSSQKSRSPSSTSKDGIKTISRRTGGTNNVSVNVAALLGVKKPAIYESKLIQSVKSTDALERMKQQAVAAPPATIGKRIQALSEPAKPTVARKFATDEDERHCRFQPKRKGGTKATADDDSEVDSKANDFIGRMEAAEKSRQKKLEMTRGENDYNARLDKKCCPKCLVPQSYSEYRDKKKRCQSCGVEFRILQAWGDVGSDFITRMIDASRSQAEKKEKILSQVISQETKSHTVKKTPKQQFYEKQMIQKNQHKSFLDRNYRTGLSSKTKQAQVEIERQTQQAKMLATI